MKASRFNVFITALLLPYLAFGGVSNPGGGKVVPTPSITISGNTATITGSDAAAEIRYTLDGSTPTGASSLYTGALTLTAGTTVTVNAVQYLAPNSAVGTATATIPDADVTAYQNNVATAGGTMTSARQTAISTFVASSKTHGTWAHLLDVWTPATDTFTGALVKLKAYAGTGSSVTNSGFVSGDYTPATGLLGASGKYLDTGFNYSTYGSSVAGYSFYAMDDSAGSALGTITGTGGGVSGDLRLLNSTATVLNVYTGRNFAINFAPSGGGTSRGLVHLERPSLTSAALYVNGVSVASDTGTMTSSPQNLTAKIFGQLNSTSNTTVSSNYVGHGGFFAIDDGGMTTTQAANFYSDVKVLMNALGRSPKSTAQARMALTTGQSLAVGSNSTATLSTTQPYTNKAVNSGNIGGSGSTHYPVNLTPLVEGLQVAGAYESIGSNYANQQASLWRADHPGDASKDLIVSNAAVGSTTIATRTSKTAGSIYNVSLQEITDAMAVAPDYYSGGFTVAGINQVDGESDASSSTFAADLLTLYNQYQTDIKALTGQTSAIPMFISQISAWTATGNINSATAVSEIQQLAAYTANPTKIILVCPKYIFQYGTGTNDVHLTQVGYRWLGEYYGKAWDAVVNRGGTWGPLRPQSITRSGATITVQCASATSNTSVPTSLAIDTTTVTSPNGAADGFEYAQTGGTAQTISSVSVSGSTITITLSGDPGSPSAERLRYAYTGTAGNAGGPTTGPRGCIRDNDAAFGLGSGNHLYNWMVTFDYAIGTTGLTMRADDFPVYASNNRIVSPLDLALGRYWRN